MSSPEFVARLKNEGKKINLNLQQHENMKICNRIPKMCDLWEFSGKCSPENHYKFEHFKEDSLPVHLFRSWLWFKCQIISI